MAKYYAVARGRVPGVYTDWNMCKAQVEKVPNSKFQKFSTSEEAVDFIKMHNDPTFQKYQTRPSVTSLPLPLSPTKKNAKLHRSTQLLLRPSLLNNLPLPLSQPKNGTIVKGQDYEVPRKDESFVTQTKSVPLHKPANPGVNAVQNTNCISSPRVPTNPDTDDVEEVSVIPSSSAAVMQHVNGAGGSQTTPPTHSSGMEAGGKSSAHETFDLEERFEKFEKIYREFHKQMQSELRTTKKMIKGFKKKALKSALVQTQLKTFVEEGMTKLEDRLKNVMVGFSAELSALQQQATSDSINTVAAPSLASNALNHTSKKLVTGAKMCTVKGASSKKGSRRKLEAMMQPMTPAQVRLVNKRSYSTDGVEDEPANKVAKSDVCHDLVPPIKVEVIDSGDEADYGGTHGFNVDLEGYVHVYTDGACEKNGWSQAKAGIGVWFGIKHPLNSSEPVRGRATNNTAEIQAAQYAIELARGAGVTKLCINTDSEFLINSITKWIHKWKKNKWQLSTGGPVKNKENFEALDAALRGMDVKWNHVRGHAGILGNEMADSLARAGAALYKKG